ncbi:PREDICTED: solute carrier family 28 member 3-like [Colobus angolensis palliatus]|uniref:solute carrier family 28 member 3-like n=1 Tax=Colobus angolensis palliatus TaxID=336983 RepID=UPI0005F43238|nr:PREDICTED: solute carrier family 28 member 3-like [Colobus angolensis palliatus]
MDGRNIRYPKKIKETGDRSGVCHFWKQQLRGPDSPTRANLIQFLKNEENFLEKENTSGNNSVRTRAVQSREHTNTKQDEEQGTVQQDSPRNKEDMEDDEEEMQQKGCLERRYDTVCGFCRKHKTTLQHIIWGILLAGYLVMVIAACVLNFHRALPLFVITVAAIFFVVWDHLMAKYEHRIYEMLSPGRRLLNSHWFWLKW